MDDKELIKRIMEEVRDEKLREELLALVAEKNRRQSEVRQEEEKSINYKARHGILSKVGGVILGIMFMFAFFFIFLAFGPLAALAFLILALLSRIVSLLSALAEEKRKK
jgi:F0F1-type ATP synthase assembly protein I